MFDSLLAFLFGSFLGFAGLVFSKGLGLVDGGLLELGVIGIFRCSIGALEERKNLHSDKSNAQMNMVRSWQTYSYKVNKR